VEGASGARRAHGVSHLYRQSRRNVRFDNLTDSPYTARAPRPGRRRGRRVPRRTAVTPPPRPAVPRTRRVPPGRRSIRYRYVDPFICAARRTGAVRPAGTRRPTCGHGRLARAGAGAPRLRTSRFHPQTVV